MEWKSVVIQMSKLKYFKIYEIKKKHQKAKIYYIRLKY